MGPKGCYWNSSSRRRYSTACACTISLAEDKKQRVKTIPNQTVQEETTDDNPPFLQPKTELQGEDSRHEMPAEDRRFELDEGNSRYEIMTQEQSRRLNVQVQQHELGSEECALELDEGDIKEVVESL